MRTYKVSKFINYAYDVIDFENNEPVDKNLVFYLVEKDLFVCTCDTYSKVMKCPHILAVKEYMLQNVKDTAKV